MIHRYLLLLLLGGALPSAAQSTLHFTVRQAPPLLADAGPNKTILKGGRAVLGGAVPAAGGSGTYTYAWTPAAGLDRADIAHPTASPDTTTAYTLTVNDPLGCRQASRTMVTVVTTTATRLVRDPWGLQAFPNPNRGTFTLASAQPLGAGPVAVAVYSSVGALVYAETFAVGLRPLDRSIVLPPHAHGFYFLRVTSRDVNSILKLLVQ